MVKAATRGHATEIIARFATKVAWDELDGDALQREVVELSPEEFGRRFTAFLRNGARLIIASLLLVLNRKAFSIAENIGVDWTMWFGERDGDGLTGKPACDTRSLALKEVDWAKVQLDTCLKEGETSITGEEKLTRLEASGNILLDAQIGFQLLEDYKSNKENSILEQLRRTKGITYVDFFGTILRNSNGDRCVLCLYWNDGQWYWYVLWLDYDWYAHRVSASLAS